MVLGHRCCLHQMKIFAVAKFGWLVAIICEQVCLGVHKLLIFIHFPVPQFRTDSGKCCYCYTFKLPSLASFNLAKIDFDRL